MRVIVKGNEYGLCGSCKYGGTMRVSGRDLIRCSHFDTWVKGRVETCSAQRAPNHSSIYDMEKIAYVLERTKGKPIGFHKPGSKQHRESMGSTNPFARILSGED